ncbi:MAG: FUSC family protein [Frankia sp.]
MHPLRWLGRRDRGLAALRRAGRAAIVMPAMFASGDKVIGNAEIATFAAFGAFAMLLLVDFGGPMRSRLAAQVALGVAGGVFVCLGTLASRSAWLAAVAMAAVAFGVIFAGVVSSVLAGATTSLLLSFILPVSLASPAATIPDRLAGWAMASGASVLAVWLLWPAPAPDPLRAPAAAACRALAARLHSDLAYRRGGAGAPTAADHEEAGSRATAAVLDLQRRFLATPYRPTGLSTTSRTVVRLVDELAWLNAIVIESGRHILGSPAGAAAREVKAAAAAVLDQGADLMESPGDGPEGLRAARGVLRTALAELERGAAAELPVVRASTGSPATAWGATGERADAATDDVTKGQAEEQVSEFISALEPSFRAQEMSFAVSAIADNIDLAAAAERRGMVARVLGRAPAGIPGALSAAQERASAHVERHSVWLHNSVRAAAGLGLAVLLANLTGVQHSFWVVLGTLSVLRSNALSTGQNVLRGVAGTVAGFLIGAGLLAAVGTNPTLLWFLLPPAILVAGVAPAAVSFAAGQGAFTLVLVILFNIIEPAGWRVGLVRVEDIVLGCAVSLVVGLFFWPRGAGAALSRALADAYTDSARYLEQAVAFGMQRCDPGAWSGPPASEPQAAQPPPVDALTKRGEDGREAGLRWSRRPPPAPVPPTAEATRAAAASRRLDDTFRSYLAERGAKPVPLAEMSSLVTGVVGLRLAADAVLALWQRDDGSVGGDRRAARAQLLAASDLVRRWYDDLALSLTGHHPVREPLAHDRVADGRLVGTVRHDLRAQDGRASATAVRMIWTGDHLDSVRRLQSRLVEPAREATERHRAAGPIATLSRRLT